MLIKFKKQIVGKNYTAIKITYSAKPMKPLRGINPHAKPRITPRIWRAQ